MVVVGASPPPPPAELRLLGLRLGARGLLLPSPPPALVVAFLDVFVVVAAAAVVVDDDDDAATVFFGDTRCGCAWTAGGPDCLRCWFRLAVCASLCWLESSRFFLRERARSLGPVTTVIGDGVIDSELAAAVAVPLLARLVSTFPFWVVDDVVFVEVEEEVATRLSLCSVSGPLVIVPVPLPGVWRVADLRAAATTRGDLAAQGSAPFDPCCLESLASGRVVFTFVNDDEIDAGAAVEVVLYPARIPSKVFVTPRSWTLYFLRMPATILCSRPRNCFMIAETLCAVGMTRIYRKREIECHIGRCQSAMIHNRGSNRLSTEED